MEEDSIDFYCRVIQENRKMIFIIGFLVIIAYLSLVWLPKDNQLEQAVEKIIEAETGLDIDLTP